MARIYSSIIVAVTLLLFAHPLLSAADLAPVALENEFIRVVANPGPDEAGRFSIRTTGGDPSRPASKNQHLIFGGNAPWTSYTTLLIDGQKYVFGGPTQRRAGKTAQYGQQVTPPSVSGDKITCSYQYGDLLVTQNLSFVRGLSTRVLDTVGIDYTIDNRGTACAPGGLAHHARYHVRQQRWRALSRRRASDHHRHHAGRGRGAGLLAGIR